MKQSIQYARLFYLFSFQVELLEYEADSKRYTSGGYMRSCKAGDHVICNVIGLTQFPAPSALCICAALRSHDCLCAVLVDCVTYSYIYCDNIPIICETIFLVLL